MTPCINDYCSTEKVYAVPVHIPVCVLVQPINTVYVRSHFFSADTTASCTEWRIWNSVHVSCANKTIFHQSGHDSQAPKSFPSLSTRPSGTQEVFLHWVHDSRPRNMNFLQCVHDGRVNSHFQYRIINWGGFFLFFDFKPFENTVGKGEIARNEQFPLFPQCFLPVWITFLHFYQIWNHRLQTLSVWKSLKFVVW